MLENMTDIELKEALERIRHQAIGIQLSIDDISIKSVLFN